jgi:hypothetical protein
MLLFNFRQILQVLLPFTFERARDHSVVRIDGLVSSLGSTCFVACLLDTSAPCLVERISLHLPSHIPELHPARPPRPPPENTAGADDWLN